jgi:hypothetical protein
VSAATYWPRSPGSVMPAGAFPCPHISAPYRAFASGAPEGAWVKGKSDFGISLLRSATLSGADTVTPIAGLRRSEPITKTRATRSNAVTAIPHTFLRTPLINPPAAIMSRKEYNPPSLHGRLGARRLLSARPGICPRVSISKASSFATGSWVPASPARWFMGHTLPIGRQRRPKRLSPPSSVFSAHNWRLRRHRLSSSK